MVLKEFKPLVIVRHDVHTSMHSLAFAEGPEAIKADWVHVQREGQAADPHLCYCFCALMKGGAVMRCGPADSDQRLDDLSAALSWIQGRAEIIPGAPAAKVRVSVVQLGMPDSEWETIELQQWLLMRHPLLHQVTGPYVNLPSQIFFQQASEDTVTLQLKMIHKLSRQINCMGWLHYSDWIAAEMRQILNAVAYDALDEYQLVASIEDYSHEVASLFLNEYRQQIKEATLLLGNAEFGAESTGVNPDYQVLAEMQKKVISINNDIFANLQKQSAILSYMVERIGLIEAPHPEFVKLKEAAAVLGILLESQTDPFGGKRIAWGRQMLLHSLLDIHFHVTSLVTCSLDQERAAFAFAIKIAILQLVQHLGFTALFELAIHWEETIFAANQLALQKGLQALEDLQEESIEPSSRQRLGTLRFLRQYVLANLHALALPRTVICLEEGKVSSEYLNFLPSQVILDQKKIPFVLYDSTTGVPTHFSEKGQQLMARLLAVC